MRELETDGTYAGKIQFNIIPHTQEGFAAEIESFDIGNHGLVGFDARGELATKIAGHSFGKTEIVGVINTLLR